MSKIGQVLNKIRSGRSLAGGVLVAMVMTFSATGVASAAVPSYFDVQKPSSPAQCEGSTTTYSWEWQWGFGGEHSHHHGPWWLAWLFELFGHWVRVAHQTPNWEKLGFSSHDQCIRYVSTPQPATKGDCKNGGWYTLGFNNQGQCLRYLRLHGGGGYGGDE